MVYKYGTQSIPTAGIIILILLIVSLLITEKISKKNESEDDIEHVDIDKIEKVQQIITLKDFIIRKSKNQILRAVLRSRLSSICFFC